MNFHNSLYELFSGISKVIRGNLGNSQLINPESFSSLIDNIRGIENDYRVKTLIDKSIMYLSSIDLEGVTSIGAYAFYNCSNLALTSLPEGITSISAYAFYSCSNLTTMTFKGTPTTIASNAFVNCYNLKTINVPWAEGAVANAPWGATKATINYNYVEG